MNRRDLLKTSILSAALPFLPKNLSGQNNETASIKPAKLNIGDKAGIIAPATAVVDPDDIQKAIQAVEYFGLEYKIAENLLKGTGYKTRSIEERLDDIHEMFDDNEIKAVFCIRGGYGSGLLLNKLDFDLIKENPKIFIGYSDITAMHLAISKITGLVTFHGPVLLSAFTQYSIEYFKKALFNSTPIGKVTNPAANNGIRPAFPFRTISTGSAVGRLTGGNLSLISSLMGTPYEIDTNNKILFIEDVGEEPFRIDRMLNQLDLAGKLKQAKGIIFGKCAGCDNNSQSVWDSSLGEVLDSRLGDLGIPVFYGLMIGHTSEQLTLPYGVIAELNAGEGTLDIQESGVF